MRNICLFVIGLICVSMLGCSLDGSCNYNEDKDKSSCQDKNTSKVCQADGFWENINCPHGCDENTGKCIEFACQMSKCENGKFSACKDDKSGFEEAVDCPLGCNAEGTDCRSCDSNKCENDKLSLCKSDKTGYEEEQIDCLLGCNDDGTACNQSCTADVCKDDYLYRCIDNQLSAQGEKCPDLKGNFAGACANGSMCKQCDESVISLKRRCITLTSYNVCVDGIWSKDIVDCPGTKENNKYCESITNSCTGITSSVICILGKYWMLDEGVTLFDGIPCPNNASCKQSGDACGECNDYEDTKCENNLFYKCKFGEYIISDCSLGLGCHTNDDGKGVCNECDSNRCSNDSSGIGNIKECANGSFNGSTACENNGEPVSCQSEMACGECLNGTTRCDGNILQTCKFGKWEISKICSGSKPLCNADENACKACISKTKQCVDDTTLWTCSSSGKKWTPTTCSETKPFCDITTNKCVSKVSSCTDGTIKCQNNTLLTCQDGSWKSEPCEYGCYDATQCNKCQIGKMDCVGATRRVCNGLKWGEEQCDYGCLTEDKDTTICKCSHDANVCLDANNAKHCQHSGKWEFISCLGGCSQGQCRECLNGEKKCEEGQAFNCINHVWQIYSCSELYEHVCDDKTYDKATCTSECKIGEAKCKDGNLLKCENNEHGAPWWTSQQVPCKCNPGEIKCNDSNNSLVCDENGSWITTHCEFGCDAETGECLENGAECVDGWTRCGNIKNSPMQMCIQGKYYDIACSFNNSKCADNKCSTTCEADACVQLNKEMKMFVKFVCDNGEYNYQKYTICNDADCSSCSG